MVKRQNPARSRYRLGAKRPSNDKARLYRVAASAGANCWAGHLAMQLRRARCQNTPRVRWDARACAVTNAVEWIKSASCADQGFGSTRSASAGSHLR